MLNGADLRDAVVTGASFEETTSRGFTSEQLYSTASYTYKDLSGIGLAHNDLSGWNFAGQNLTGADFSDATLTNTDVSRSDLTEARFGGATLTDTNLGHANLTGAEFQLATLTSVDLSHAELAGAILARATLTSTDLSHADLQGADLSSATLTSVDLRYAELEGADLDRVRLMSADLSHADLTGANLRGAILTGSDLSDAVVAGASFELATFIGDFTAEQLYSTASYKNKDLSGIGLRRNYLLGWNLAGQNLTGADLSAALSGADLTGADLRGAQYSDLEATRAITRNVITSTGAVFGLELRDGESLWIRDYDGLPEAPSPIPITIFDAMSVSEGGELRIIFESDPWDSTISFEPGIPVHLDGSLELGFAADVEVATQVGRTLSIFDWTGVDPSGEFDVTSPYLWDLRYLYTTGEVRLTGSGSVGDYDGSGVVDQGDLDFVLSNWGAEESAPPAGWINDLPLGLVDQAELDRVLANWGRVLRTGAVPEPSGLVLAGVGLCSALYVLRGGTRDCFSDGPDALIRRGGRQ